MKQWTSSSLVLLSLLLAFGCKDEEPCDGDEQAVGTGCFPRNAGGSGGSGGGSPAEGGAPSGNPDATFGTPCESDADCGGDAPICDYKQFHYCLQTECEAGEQNEGACPEDWTCFKLAPNPSACIKL